MGDIYNMTTDPIRDMKQLREIAGYWLNREIEIHCGGGNNAGMNVRNYALIVLGVYTALRIGDLLRIRWEDVYDFKHAEFREHITLTEMKTGKQKTIALHAHAKNALRLYLPYRRGAFVFTGNRKDAMPITRVQAWRVIRDAAVAIKAAERIACHSLRKTFGYFAWKSGVQPVIIMDIFNHSSFEVTKRYLGIAQDDKDKVYLGMRLF